MRAQLQRLDGNLAAGLSHSASVRLAIAVAVGAGDLDAVLAPDALELKVGQDQGALLVVEPVASDEDAAIQRLPALRQVGGGDGLLCRLGHDFLQDAGRPSGAGRGDSS